MPAPRAGAVPAQGLRLPASLPLKRDDDQQGIGAQGVALTAGGILLLAVWLAAQLRRRTTGGAAAKARGRAGVPWLRRLVAAPGALRVLETAALTSQVRMHVVAWHGREYLVSTSADAVRIVDRRDPPPAAPERERDAGRDDGEGGP